MIKTFNDTNDEGWYGTKEELKESEDFYPFILIKLGVPSNIQYFGFILGCFFDYLNVEF